MLTTLTKGLIQVVMTALIPITGIIYWGATNVRGKLCIALAGLLIYVVLAIWYVWVDRRPEKFTDWL